MKIHLPPSQKIYLGEVIRAEMKNKKSFLKKAPVDERKLFIRAAELNLQYAGTEDIGVKHVNHLTKKAKRFGIPKAVIKNREGLKYNPEISPFLKKTEQLKNALVKYLDAK